MSRNKREGYYCGVSSGKFERAWPRKRKHLYSFQIVYLNRKQFKELERYNNFWDKI